MRLNFLIAPVYSGISRKTFEPGANCIKSGQYRTILNRRRSLFTSPGTIAFDTIF